MGEQSASRLEGDRYQHLYGWYELLRLLDEGSPFEQGFVEHPEAGAADDVTLHARPGAGVASRYVQVKWHVDHRELYSVTSLVTPTPKGGRSLLRKLFEGWRKLQDSGPVEVWLVSNWGADPGLGRFIRGSDHSLTEDFFATDAPGSPLHEWEQALTEPPELLRSFFRALRLRLGFESIANLEEQVDERMGRLGLRRDSGARAVVLDGVRRWIETGGPAKRHDRESLGAFIQEQDLRAPVDGAPRVSLWIHGWERQRWTDPPTEELDWTHHFDRATRKVPDAEVWQTQLLPELVGARQRLSTRPEGRFIDFRGRLPLSTTLSVGVHFPEVAGYRFRLEQPTQGQLRLWRSDAGPSARKLRTREVDGPPDARDLLVVFQLTGDGSPDVERFQSQRPGRFRAVVYLEPEDGPGDGAVTSAGDAVAFAVQARQLLREARARLRTETTHLILFAPASCCLLLGQRLNALGSVVTYERTVAGGYVPSLTLETG